MHVAVNRRLIERPARHENIIARAIGANHQIKCAIAFCHGQGARPRRTAIHRTPNPGARSGIKALAVIRADDQIIHVIKVRRHRRRQMRPGRAAVRRFINANASMAVEIAEAFARARIKHVGVFRIERQRSHGQIGQQIGQGIPCASAVRRFPDAAADARDIHNAWVGWMNLKGARASAQIARPQRHPRAEPFISRCARNYIIARRQYAIFGRRVTRHRVHLFLSF